MAALNYYNVCDNAFQCWTKKERSFCCIIDWWKQNHCGRLYMWLFFYLRYGTSFNIFIFINQNYLQSIPNSKTNMKLVTFLGGENDLDLAMENLTWLKCWLLLFCTQSSHWLWWCIQMKTNSVCRFLVGIKRWLYSFTVFDFIIIIMTPVTFDPNHKIALTP